MRESLVPKNLGLQESRLSAQPDMFCQSLEVHVARYHEVLHVSDPPRGSIDVHQRVLEDVHQQKAENVQCWGYANLRKIKAIITKLTGIMTEFLFQNLRFLLRCPSLLRPHCFQFKKD